MATVTTKVLPTCQRCLLPMGVTVPKAPGSSPRLLTECAKCHRLLEITLTGRVLRPGVLAGIPRNGGSA
ncbi:MAG: hypothetical protein HY724_00780 [Candidatus Rokubacteria bacterium]|nr:hypothetical protein [Candidatus Rokubacteria bacterium]